MTETALRGAQNKGKNGMVSIAELLKLQSMGISQPSEPTAQFQDPDPAFQDSAQNPAPTKVQFDEESIE